MIGNPMGNVLGNPLGNPLGLTSGSSNLSGKKLVVGDSLAGGFYFATVIQGSDTFVLVVADKSAEVSLAYATASSVTGATSTSDSKFNTDILAAPTTGFPAAKYCRSYQDGTWDMPASDILTLMKNVLGTSAANPPEAFKFGGPQAFGSDPYSSSSELSSTQCFGRGMATNTTFQLSKTTANIVRPVKAIRVSKSLMSLEGLSGVFEK